jgi:hypothetical protein
MKAGYEPFHRSASTHASQVAVAVGSVLLIVLALGGVASAVALFNAWWGAGDFQGIIPGWPVVAAGGFIWSLVLAWLTWRSWHRPWLRFWTGAVALLIGMALLATAAFGFSLDSAAFLDFLVAPVIFPLLMSTSGLGDTWRIGLAAPGIAFLSAGALLLWTAAQAAQLEK